MSFHYMIPTLGVRHTGYDCTIDPPFDTMARVLVSGDSKLLWRLRTIHDGEQRDVFETELDYEGGKLASAPPAPFVLAAEKTGGDGDPGFFETDFVVADGSPDFVTNQPLVVPYAVYSAPGRKSFFSTPTNKFAVPSVINMVAEYGRFIETYPVVSIDRARDYGESIAMINPYNKDIIAEVQAYDGRQIRRIRVPRMSARYVRLDRLLKAGETSWNGRIQLTANNRVVTFDVKHSLANPEIISDEEHLDPFRADPTHVPAFQAFRLGVGRYLQLRGLLGRAGRPPAT